jgi:hypothetical protein
MKIEDCRIGQLVQVMTLGEPEPRSVDRISVSDGNVIVEVPKVGHIIGYVFNVQDHPELCVCVQLAGLDIDFQKKEVLHPNHVQPYNPNDVMAAYDDDGGGAWG